MGGETLSGPGVPDDMDVGPVGEYPAGINDIVGSRTIPAPGVKSEDGLREAVKGGKVRALLEDLMTRGIHGEPALERPHQITIFTSRNKAALATVALAAAAAGTAYALRKRHQRNTGGAGRTAR